MLGGVMRSPLTGIVFCLELTHEINAMIPMVITASVAYLLSVIPLKRSVPTEKPARRGLHLTRRYSVDPLAVHLVRQLETRPPSPSATTARRARSPRCCGPRTTGATLSGCSPSASAPRSTRTAASSAS
ncbi:chloride channel protein [Streptomyces spinosirectus]